MLAPKSTLSPSREIGTIVLEHPLFAGLAAELQDQAMDSAEIRSIDAQSVLFRQDADANDFFIIIDGAIDIEIPALAGCPALIQTLGPGSPLGWSWMFPPYRWHFDGRAAVQSTVLRIDGAALRTFCDDKPALGYPLLQRVAALMMERLEAARLRVIDLHDDSPR